MLAGLNSQSPARWSPDGLRIAYSDGASIRIANADGSGTYPLAAHGGVDRCPAWSPDGTQLIYCHAPAVGSGELFCMARADGSEARVLPKGTLTEPGRDGLVRSNPRLLPYEDNVLSVFAPDWRGAGIRPAASAAALRPISRICVWGVGKGQATAAAGWQDFLGKRVGWNRVFGTPVQQDTLVVESERLIVVFGAARSAAILCSKPINKQVQTVELIPVSETGEAACNIESLKLVHNDGQEAVVEVSTSTSRGRMVRTSWKIEGDWPLVQVRAMENTARLRLAAPLHYAVIPDRFADDLVYEPASYAGSRVALPLAPMSLGLLGSGNAELVVVCPSQRQTLDLLKDAGRDGPFSGVEACFAGERLVVGLLAGSNLWHAERPGVKYERSRINLGWDIPGPGAWRLAVRAGGRNYAEMFDEKASRRLEGIRLSLTAQEEFTGVIDLALVYIYGGSSGTPPDRLLPADLALHGMGIGPFLKALDIEGLQSYRTAPRQTTWADIFATLASLRYLYDNEVAKEEQAFAGHLCDDVPALLEGMDGRLAEFAQFTRQVAQTAGIRETAHASFLAAAIRPACEKLEEACKKRERLPAAAEATRLTTQIQGLASRDLPDKKERFLDLWQRLSREARARAEIIRAFRGAVRELASAAGMCCAEHPEFRREASRLRNLAQGVLRNRYYVERDWRGELQREPPDWLGPPPY